MDQAADLNLFTDALHTFHRETMPRLREKIISADPSEKPAYDALLEHHVRVFVIDELLGSMGWKTRPTSTQPLNTLPEAPMKGAGAKSRTQFLDYLGFDQEGNLPLLIFEAKRLGMDPPSVLVEAYRQKLSGKSSVASSSRISVKANKAFVEALMPRTPRWVNGQWKAHVGQIKKYFKATVEKFGMSPSVMVIGNGEWMVILRSPALIFEGKADETHLEIIDDPGLVPGEAYRLHFDRIHEAIAYWRLAKQAPHLPPELVPQALREASVVEFTRGLSLDYTSTNTSQRPGARPYIDILPVILVRVPGGEWSVVTSGAEGLTLPNGGTADPLRSHIDDVKAASDGLLERVGNAFLAKLVEVDLATLSREATGPGSRAFVTRESISRETHSQSFLLLTGASAHFIQLTPRIDCALHDWSKCDPNSVGRHPPDRPLSAPSYAGLRSFFPNGRAHHCAAAATYHLKSIPPSNLALTAKETNSSLGKHPKPFCKIFDFEAMLCCQTCVYLDVCSSAASFRLPCLARGQKGSGETNQNYMKLAVSDRRDVS